MIQGFVQAVKNRLRDIREPDWRTDREFLENWLSNVFNGDHESVVLMNLPDEARPFFADWMKEQCFTLENYPIIGDTQAALCDGRIQTVLAFNSPLLAANCQKFMQKQGIHVSSVECQEHYSDMSAKRRQFLLDSLAMA
jgi:hypothetical protein